MPQTPYYRYIVLVIEKVLGGSIYVPPQFIDGGVREIPAGHFPFSRYKKKDTFFHRRIINQKYKKPSNLSTGDGASFYAAVEQKKLISFSETSCN